MIPLIIGGGAALGLLFTGATGVFAYCGNEVNKDLRSKIECINRQSQEMIDETKKIITTTQLEEEKAYYKLLDQRTQIYNKTFKKAEELTEKIKVKDQSNIENELHVFEAYISNASYYLENSANITSRVIPTVGFAVGGFAGMLVGTAISGVALEFKVDEALERKEKIRAECESAKLECTKIKHITNVMNDSYKIIKRLDSLTKKTEDYIEEVFEEKGNDLSKWTENEIEALRTMFNFLKALSDIINIEIITAKGNISTKYKKLVGEIELLGNEYE